MIADDHLKVELGAMLDDATQLSEITPPSPHEDTAPVIAPSDNAASTSSSSELWALLGMQSAMIVNSRPTPKRRRKVGTPLTTDKEAVAAGP
jgi:hypothetical protein